MTGDISKHHAISLKSYKWSMKVESSPSRKERLDIDFSLNELQLKWAIHSWKHESVDQKAGSLVPGQLHWCREDHTDRTYCKCQEPSEPKKTEGSISCSNHVGFHRPGSLKRMVGPEDSRMVSRHWKLAVDGKPNQTKHSKKQSNYPNQFYIQLLNILKSNVSQSHDIYYHCSKD